MLEGSTPNQHTHRKSAASFKNHAVKPNKCWVLYPLLLDFTQALVSKCSITALRLLSTFISFSSCLVKLQEELCGDIFVDLSTKGIF